MSATDELRRLLDEHGVEHEGGERSLRWRDRYGIMMQAFPLADGELGMEVWSCTPEQAVEATLGTPHTTHAVTISDESTDCATGHCECELCGQPIDPWDKYCRHCGAEVVTDG